MFTGRFETVQKAAFQSPKLTLTTSQVVNHPPGVSRAKVTIQDGGASGGTSTGAYGTGGVGGDAAIYWVDVDPTVPWTVVIGAGGIGPIAVTSLPSNAGGVTTITPRGQATYSTANAVAAGALKIPGGTAMCFNVSGGVAMPGGGSSLFAMQVALATSATGYGGGGGGGNTNLAGPNGFQGIVIIEYIAPGA